MRTTLDIDDDVLAAAEELASDRKRITGQVISDVVREALTRPMGAAPIERNGLYVLPPRGGVVTSALVRRLEEQADLRDAGLLSEN